MNRGVTYFHPDFPNYWQVVESNVRPYSALPAFYPQGDTEARGDGDGGNVTSNHNDASTLPALLPNQVVRGKVWDATWIQLFYNGSFVKRTAVTPYFPVYRITADTHPEAHGVAPYVVPRPQVVWPNPQNDKTWQYYDTDSPLRRNDLAQPVGHVFDVPPLLTIGPNNDTPPPDNSNWWTMDGQTWWPRTVRNKIPCTQMYFPTWVPKLGTKVVTDWTTPVETEFIRQTFGHREKALWIVAMILLEYLMIVGGALAGVEYGWSARLQLVYLALLLCLVLGEIGLVAWLVPNGRLWVQLNLGNLVGCIVKGVLWRWDLYGDVGFAIVAYQQRDRINDNFWIIPTALTTLVLAGRFGACVYYLRKSSWPMDEKSLSKVTVPSFLTVFGLLCQDMQLGNPEWSLSSARTEMRFEAWRTGVEDFPEIILQAVYLFGHQAPPTCTQCAFGFVFVSLLVSIATSFPGLLRLYNAFSRYTMFQTEVQTSSMSLDTGKKKIKKSVDVPEPTERHDESHTENQVRIW